MDGGEGTLTEDAGAVQVGVKRLKREGFHCTGYGEELLSSQ